MQTDPNRSIAYYASPLQPHHPRHYRRNNLGRSGVIAMTSSPYTSQLPSNSSSSSSLGHFSPPSRLHNNYYHSQHALPSTHFDYSSYSTASAESPLSSSSANESPLPEPPFDSMEPEAAAHVVTGNDDYYASAVVDDMAAAGYPYGYGGARPLSMNGFMADNQEMFKQPVSAPMPMPVSVAMGYSWSPETKKFQPLYPPVQQLQRQDADIRPYGGNIYDMSSMAPAHPTSRSTRNEPQRYGSDLDDVTLSYPTDSSSRAFASLSPPVVSLAPSQSNYQRDHRVLNMKQESDARLLHAYNAATEEVNPSKTLGAYSTQFDMAPRPELTDTVYPKSMYHGSPSSSTPSDPHPDFGTALRYVHNNAQMASMGMPLLTAPVPRHSAYMGSSIATNCERSCQEQEQARQRLRVQTQDLQSQGTVRPAEVSPVMGYEELPGGENVDADGERDSLPFGHRRNDSAGGNNTGNWMAKKEGFGVSEPSCEPVAGAGSHYDIDAEGDEDAEGEDEIDVNDDDDEYNVDDGEEIDDDDDGEFMPNKRSTSKTTRSLRPRCQNARYSPYSTTTHTQHALGKRASNSPTLSTSTLSPNSTPELPQRFRKNARTLPIPVPVPNLTKKSRGRRVPTVNSVGRGHRVNEVALSARIYLCDVTGCGKCFARGEHLKRHIRSIHTYEKPHKCPYPSCGKEFSRHDNLGQHMRVHKDYPKILEKLEAGNA